LQISKLVQRFTENTQTKANMTLYDQLGLLRFFTSWQILSIFFKKILLFMETESIASLCKI
jgi:hypothetical protein